MTIRNSGDRDIRALALFLLAFLATLTIVGACTPNKRVKTLHVALVSVNAVRDGFVAWDRQHQHEIVELATSREDGLAKLAAYHAKRDAALRVNAQGRSEIFELAYMAISIAATQTDELSLTAALAKADELARALAILMSGGG